MKVIFFSLFIFPFLSHANDSVLGDLMFLPKESQAILHFGYRNSQKKWQDRQGTISSWAINEYKDETDVIDFQAAYSPTDHFQMKAEFGYSELVHKNTYFADSPNNTGMLDKQVSNVGFTDPKVSIVGRMKSNDENGYNLDLNIDWSIKTGNAINANAYDTNGNDTLDAASKNGNSLIGADIVTLGLKWGKKIGSRFEVSSFGFIDRAFDRKRVELKAGTNNNDLNTSTNDNTRVGAGIDGQFRLFSSFYLGFGGWTMRNPRETTKFEISGVKMFQKLEKHEVLGARFSPKIVIDNDMLITMFINYETYSGHKIVYSQQGSGYDDPTLTTERKNSYSSTIGGSLTFLY
jgi:hypothetical protein